MNMSNKISYLSLALICTLPTPVFAADYSQTPSNAEGSKSIVMQEVQVVAPRIEEPKMLQGSTINSSTLPPLRAATSDTTTLMSSQPGLSLYTGGGVSNLPVLHGMADDRIRINVDGRELPSACGNHMNPPLSYIDPSNVAKIDVIGGITPVSSGGDNIAGTISVQSIDPQFAKPGSGTLLKGKAAAFNRSNGQNYGSNLGATLASEKLSLMLQGSTTRAGDYNDGHDQKVKSTAFAAENYSVTLAGRNQGNLVTIDVGGQDIPFQDFVNAHMDMTGNQAKFVNGRYEGQFSWGKLDTQIHWENTKHQMNTRGDKLPGMNMPMNTDGTTYGYLLKAEIELSEQNTLRVGNEFTHFELDDWWPASPAQATSACNTGVVSTSTCSMAPGTLLNINNGRRNRLGSFVEWHADWQNKWSSLLGLRNDIVWMNTDDVIGYNSNPAATNSAAYATDAQEFNATDHARQDVNFDLTALLRYQANQTSTYEGGYARKSRAPNLYERYLWIQRSSMSTRMNSAVGDANGYAGNLNLEPEVAHTFSFTAKWHDKNQQKWSITATPYYTRVQDYIDAERCQVLNGGNACTVANRNATTGLVNLKYANHDAQLYGMDLSARTQVAETQKAGNFALAGEVGYVRGENLDSGDDLYHIMPLNAKITLEHQLNNWSNSVEFQGVARKEDISAVRNELKTGGYGLVNLKTGYQWGTVRLDAGIDNLLDKAYNHPLGGTYWIGDTSGKTPVPGMGRSAYVGMSVEF